MAKPYTLTAQELPTLATFGKLWPVVTPQAQHKIVRAAVPDFLGSYILRPIPG